MTEKSTILFEDNTACVTQMKKSYIKGDKTKHISSKFFSTRKLEEASEINIQQIKSNENLTDLFTKSLPPKKFEELVYKIGMCSLRDVC